MACFLVFNTCLGWFPSVRLLLRHSANEGSLVTIEVPVDRQPRRRLKERGGGRMETNALTETARQSVSHEVMKEVVAKLDPQVFAC